MIALTSLTHIALRVRDINRSLAFYTGKLGMQEMMRMLYNDGSLSIVYLKITDDQFLELFPDGAGDGVPEPGAVGLNHFCLRVVDPGFSSNSLIIFFCAVFCFCRILYPA